MNNVLNEIASLESQAKGYRARANKASNDKAAKLGQLQQLESQEAGIIEQIKSQGLDPAKLAEEEASIKAEIMAKFAQLDAMLPDENGVFPQSMTHSSDSPEDIHVSVGDAALDNIPE